MLLSRLVFNCVKNVVYLNDTGFTYETFLEGLFNNDTDYSTNINNVFAPLNEAIARLNDLERIPYKICEIPTDNIENGIVDFHYLGIDDVQNVINVVQVSKNHYENVAFGNYGINKIIIKDYCTPNQDITIEYKIAIKSFSYEDIKPIDTDENGYPQDKNIDLRLEYGISESAANYIMEYVQGKLQEPLAPELANLHVTRAEQYFMGLPSIAETFAQQRVQKKYCIE